MLPPADPSPADDAGTPPRWARWWPLLVVVAGLPLVVLVVALAQRTWYPTGDLAQAELRMRSLPSHPPLVGAAGRITDAAGRQGNHPGPLMFWVTWPLYALLGRSSWAFEAATTLVNLAWLATSVWLVRKAAGVAVAAGYVAVALVLVGGFGLDGLSQPWNPWVALLPFTVLLVTTWNALDGWRWAPVVAVASGSYAIQGHVGYAPVAAPLVLASVVAPIWLARRRARRPEPGTSGDDGQVTVRLRYREAPSWVLPTASALLLGVTAWSGPIVDAVRNDPSNAQKLASNFGSPSEDPVGVVEGAKLLLRTAAPLGAWVTGGLDLHASIVPGLALLLAWAAVAAVVARRGDQPALVRLDLVLAASLAFGLFATSRIFGAAYLYVFRWAVVLAGLVVFTLLWGVATLLPRPAPGLTRRLGAAAVALLVLGSVATAVRVSRQEIPYDYSWKAEEVLAPRTAAALQPGTRYLVDWEDPVYLGGVGFGLLLDLERRGFDVGSPAPTATAVEPRRVRCPGGYDAVLTAVTGPLAIAAWKAKPDARVLAESGPSDPGFDYQATFDELQRTLAAEGTDLDPAQLERSLTLVVLSPAAPAAAHRLASRLVSEGVPTAVFLQDPAPVAGPVAHTVANEPCWK
ncbi:hypothetical protein KSP35_04660 [Aquihabitans sp. G128]|uniref:hypothetical protein n=1 Tax=Aquihabitans sp. G128 TaxID=2849779 RepID=UPI001C23F077|nr:hypothetical protein [Aquihabitans sp. G128]QXC62106.1 hypothetical protein KSP35_04660 [Aquihabitans sp. G128]